MAEPILRDRVALGTATGALFAPAQEHGLFRAREVDLPSADPRPMSREVPEILARPVRQRTKIWELGANLHCSIIGTCLSTAELRQVLIKMGRKEAANATEHDVHASGVLLASKHRDVGKLLHKALDRRHRAAINRFDRAKTEAEVRALWQEAVRGTDIPGAYRASLTHPATTDAVVREIFAEVHMLSHLVGAANRADIRRLRQLEAEKTELEAKVDRQQRQLRDAIVARHSTIRELSRALEVRIDSGRNGATAPVTADGTAWQALADDLKSRLTRAEARRERVERQLIENRATLIAEGNARNAAEQRECELREELEAIEASLTTVDVAQVDGGTARQRLAATLLYVDGRPAGIGHLRR